MSERVRGRVSGQAGGGQVRPAPSEQDQRQEREITVTDPRLREDTVRELAIKYGIPANPVRFAATAAEAGHAAEEAATAAGATAVAIKLVADGVVHKSKAGGVLLGVPAGEAAAATDKLLAEQRARGVDVSGVTVEAMVEPGLEVAVGALHDPGFGPVVMFGAGGVDIETLGDIAFALAPLDRADAEALIGRTRIGQAIRGRLPEAYERLTGLLLAVGGPEGMLLSEPVDQIDLNPVVVGPRSSVVAVDARATAAKLRTGACDLPDPRAMADQLTPAIYPRSIAVLGASADPRKLGHRAVRNLVDQGFSGAIHPVSRSSTQICGVPALAGACDLPEGVDRAVVALPAAAVPGALRDLAARGVRTAHVYTADTSSLAEAVAGTGLRVLGPNCIGHYTPYCALTMIGPSASSTEPGRIAVVSQSGTYAGDVVRRGGELGVRFSFVSSVGNCDDVSPSELLAFCEADERTQAVAFYLEDDRDAGRFFRLAATMTKPVVLFKGGRSAAGSAAAASHTGALASDPKLLRDAARQAGVTLVDDLDALLDLLLVLQHVPEVAGDGLGLVGSGGGVAVVGADTAYAWDLSLAGFRDATARALRPFAAPGTSLDNPVDIPIWSLYDETGPFTGALAGAVAADPGIDAICAYLDLGTVFDLMPDAEAEALIEDLVTDLLKAPREGTPLVLVLRSGFSAEQDALVRRLRPVAAEHGVPLLDSVDRAIGALGRVRELSRAGRRGREQERERRLGRGQP